MIFKLSLSCLLLLFFCSCGVPDSLSSLVFAVDVVPDSLLSLVFVREASFTSATTTSTVSVGGKAVFVGGKAVSVGGKAVSFGVDGKIVSTE